uniref:Conserved oligomeric Golgi complex subunit 3 n=1 Tax=Strongyloides papillosus TaxID=174720 RepID=A0A0N5BVY6_STREA
MDAFTKHSEEAGHILEEKCNLYYDEYLFEGEESDENDKVNDSSVLLASKRLEALRFTRKLENEACASIDGIIQNVEDIKNMESLYGVLQVVNEIEDKRQELTKIFEDLKKNYLCVTEKTSSLHHACEAMLSQQTHLAAGAEEIKTNLHYYQQVQWVMKKLQTPKLSVTGTLFTQILTTIKDCMTFLETHPDYKESAIYLEKYEQCLSKSFTVLKMSLFSDFEKAKNNVLEKKNENPKDDLSQYTEEEIFTLLYGVFGVKAFPVMNAFTITNKYFSNHPDYQVLVIDCLKEYISIRWELISGIITATIEDLLKEHASSTCVFLKKSCSFLLRICDDEFRLMKEFFILPKKVVEAPSVPRGSSRCSVTSYNSSRSRVLQRATPLPAKNDQQTNFMNEFSEVFDGFTECICRILYDTFRPTIVQNKYLELLVQLYKIVKYDFIQERCINVIKLIPEADNWIHARTGFIRVMNELSGDIVERVIYKTHTFTETDIIGYVPCSGDLLYPEKLMLLHSIDETQNSDKNNESKNMHALWYPTVKRTLLGINRIYQCLDNDIFQSFMLELITACCESLEIGSERIKSTKSSVKSNLPRFVDGDLFLIKYLLILRDQTIPYRSQVLIKSHNTPTDDEFTRGKSPLTTMDYSFDLTRYKDYASQFFSPENRGKWFELSSDNALLNILLTPPIQVTEAIQDSKRLIELRLKKHCINFINELSTYYIGDLKKCTGFIEEWNKKTKEEIDKEDWSKNEHLSPNILNDLTNVVYKNLTKSWPEYRKVLQLYLNDKDTENVLHEAVKSSILTEFQKIEDFIQNHFKEKDVLKIPPCVELKKFLDNAESIV